MNEKAISFLNKMTLHLDW